MAQQQYKNVKVIEDTHKLLNKKIFIKEMHAFTDPMNIVDTEEVENSLSKNGVPYVLAQVETTMTDESGNKRYKKGYVLFTENASGKNA